LVTRPLLAVGEEVHEGLKLHKTGGWHAVVGKVIASAMWCVKSAVAVEKTSFAFGLPESKGKAVPGFCN